jgi:hypothetical protein
MKRKTLRTASIKYFIVTIESWSNSVQLERISEILGPPNFGGSTTKGEILNEGSRVWKARQTRWRFSLGTFKQESALLRSIIRKLPLHEPKIRKLKKKYGKSVSVTLTIALFSSFACGRSEFNADILSRALKCFDNLLVIHYPCSEPGR